MKRTLRVTLATLSLMSLSHFPLFSQVLENLVPLNTATHTSVKNGSWFDPLTWDVGTVPGDAAIVVISAGDTVGYQGGSAATHVFAIRVDGVFNCTQTNSPDTTFLTFDTFVGTASSQVTFLAQNATDGKIHVTISPFDIEAHRAGTSGFSQTWNANALSHFTDGAPVEKVVRQVTGTRRYNTYQEAVNGNTAVVELSRTAYDDGVGVTGRYNWDTTQLSIGMVAAGELQIIGQQKLGMAKLSSDAAKGQKTIQLSQVPTGWEVGDTIIVTRGGNISTVSNGEDLAAIASINGSTITTVKNLKKNHEGRLADGLHCYAGDLTRNILFRSAVKNQVHQRGHFMAMHNTKNVQIRNAAFKDMGRTDKSTLLNDFIWQNWRQPVVFKSKISPLGQEVSEMQHLPAAEITNSRGRYSIHLHRTGATFQDSMVFVTGNVVWGNPGWGITQHDSYATISDNVVFDITGAGIVSESGSELGFWDNNLVVDVKKGQTLDVYDGAVFYDDYLFSGQGLGMKGRGVVCRGNVIANANQGVGIMNMNPAFSPNQDRVDAKALATFRPGFEVNQFPLDTNGYSSEGDGIMPVEVSLILENTTVIGSTTGLRSIERDMGVNHESRSVFDGFKAWGTKSGLSINYQTDYSFRDVFVSGNNAAGGTVGVVMWKHSHNQVFDSIKLVDLDYGVNVSRLVLSGNGNLKTRNNGFTPWIFVDLSTQNVTDFYEIVKDDPSIPVPYTEHSDNTIHLSSSELSPRPTTFTILDSTGLQVDVGAGNFRFMVDGIITDNLGSFKMGVEQAPAQFNLRLDYPERIYEFASQTKFEEYLTANGVYQDATGGLYFILHEKLPDRRTYQYTSFPVRVKILNAPATGVYANPQTEAAASLVPQNRLISRFASVSQSSKQAGLSYGGEAIDPYAAKATDGNNNGRINCQVYQQGLVPVGSFSQTQLENEPWFDLDLGEKMTIDFIDLWNTVELNGPAIETTSAHFGDFYVLISDSPFGTSDLATARAMASHEIYEPSPAGAAKRKASYNNLNMAGRYVRIQAVGSTIVKLAEVEVIGRPFNQLKISPKIFLEGPYSGGMMGDALRSQGMLPNDEPYTALGFPGGDPLPTVAASVFAVTGNDAIVDWVFVELRDKDDPTVVRRARACLLQADGDVVDLDGVSPVAFNGGYDGDYYVALRHRNHLGLMTSAPQTLSATPLALNFTDGTTATYGTNAQKEIEPGTFALWAADLNASGTVDAADRSEAWNQRNVIGYFSSDATMNGTTDAADRSLTWNNRNLTGQLP